MKKVDASHRLKASNYMSVFDFHYNPIRVIEHALPSLSGRMQSYAVVTKNPQIPVTFHNQHWFLAHSACPVNQLWLCSLYLGYYSFQEKRDMVNHYILEMTQLNSAHILLIKFLTPEWDVFTFPRMGRAKSQGQAQCQYQWGSTILP